MCYQEVRWHILCNHTIRSRTECPRRCAQHGAIDSVETQLTAYCHACRLHVDNLGIARRRSSKRASSLRGSSESTRTRTPAGSIHSVVDNVHLAAGSPAPSVTSLWNTPVSLQQKNRGNSPALPGNMRRSISNESSKAVCIGAIMDGLRQQQEAQEWQGQAQRQPEMLSPIPQKPQLSLRIPEVPDEQPTPPWLDTDAALSENTDLKDLSPMTKASTRTSGNPTTPRTPTSISSSLEESSSKPPPTAPLPSLPSTAPHPPDHHQHHPFSTPPLITTLRQGLWSSKAPSRLIIDPPAPTSKLERTPSDATATTTLSTSASATPAASNSPAEPSEPSSGSPLELPSPPVPQRSPLRNATNPSSPRFSDVSARNWEVKTTNPVAAAMSVMNRPRPRPRGGANYFPAAKRVKAEESSGGSGGDKLIDVHDPAWLAKHGLKWDVRELVGVANNAAVQIET